MIRLPEDAGMIGQVRFARQGSAVLATAGIRIFDYDIASESFSDRTAELSGAGMGVDQKTLQAVLAEGTVPFVRIEPDVGESTKLFTYAPLELQALDPAAKSVETLRTDNSDFEFRGMAAIDQERRGHASTLAVVQSLSRDDRIEFQLRYVSGSDGVLRGKDGRLLPPFAQLSVVPGDFAKHKPDSCRVSPHVSFLACQYRDKEAQGIVVWRLLGGDHVFARTAERYNATSALQLGDNDLLVSADAGLERIANHTETRLADLPDGWRLVAAEGDSVVAMSTSAKLGRIFRLSEDKLVEAVPPIAAVAISLVPGGDRALVQDTDRISLVNVATGATLWTAPIGDTRYSRIADA